MHTREQADATVGGRGAVQAKLTMGYVDEHLLEQVGEHRIANPFAQHQAHQRRMTRRSALNSEGGRVGLINACQPLLLSSPGSPPTWLP